MYINSEGYLCIDSTVIEPKNKSGLNTANYSRLKVIKYKVNKQGLFEEVKD